MTKIRAAIVKHLWWLIACAGLALLLCHSLQIATITVDTTSIVLLALILLSPFAAAIKRIKIGDFEAEIDPQEVRRVTEDVASKVADVERTGTALPEHTPPAISAIRQLAATDIVVALAKLRIELETGLRRLRSRAAARGKTISPRAPLHHIIRDLTAEDILPRDLGLPIRDVLALCNRAIHGETIREQDAQAVIQAGAELLQAFDRINREFGVAHPIEKVTITGAEVEDWQQAQYKVVSLIPLVENPQRVTYLLTHEELEDYFDGYADFAEFVVSIERVNSNG